MPDRRAIPDSELLAAADRAAAQAAHTVANMLIEMLRRHVLDWGRCSHPHECGCSDGQARRFLAGEFGDPGWLEPAVIYTDPPTDGDTDAGQG